MNRLHAPYALKIAIMSILMLIPTACDQTTPDTPTLEAVTVQLKWVHQAQFAGFYVALEEGYYADENLDVTLLPAGLDIDVYESLTNGLADFAVAGADSIIIKRHEGTPVKALATTYRINPFALAVKAESGIRTPEDLVGKRVSITMNFDQVQFNAMLTQAGVNPDDIELIPYDDTTGDLFLAGEVDAIGTFLAGEFIALQEKAGDQELSLIFPGDFGVHFYSDTIIALDSLIEQNPDRVLRFLRATLKGHQRAIENATLALRATMRYAVIQDERLQTKMLLASQPLIHTGKDPIGWMHANIWAMTEQVLLDAGFIDAPMPLEDIYTMQFLSAIYGGDE